MGLRRRGHDVTVLEGRGVRQLLATRLDQVDEAVLRLQSLLRVIRSEVDVGDEMGSEGEPGPGRPDQ